MARAAQEHLKGLAARLKEAVASRGTQAEAASMVDVSLAQMQNYLAAKYEPPMRTIAWIAAWSGFNLDWLLTGNGPKRTPETAAANPQLHDAIRLMGQSSIALRKMHPTESPEALSKISDVYAATEKQVAWSALRAEFEITKEAFRAEARTRDLVFSEARLLKVLRVQEQAKASLRKMIGDSIDHADLALLVSLLMRELVLLPIEDDEEWSELCGACIGWAGAAVRAALAAIASTGELSSHSRAVEASMAIHALVFRHAKEVGLEKVLDQHAPLSASARAHAATAPKKSARRKRGG